MIINKKIIIAAVFMAAATIGGAVLEHYRGATFTVETITRSDVANTVASAVPAEVNGKLNINAATAEELELLDGIGPALAQRIVDFRAENGDFTQIEGLMLVPGIGEKVYEDLKDSVCIGE